MGGANIASPFIKHLEHDVQELMGFIAIDGAHNVIGKAPAVAPLGSGPYSMLKGIDKAIGFAGAIITQPYQSTGFYQFTLDEAWWALLDWDVGLLEQGAVAIPTPVLKANVRANTTSADAGVQPGTDPTVAAQTIQLRFRLATTGALTDLAVSTGFWLRLLVKRSSQR